MLKFAVIENNKVIHVVQSENDLQTSESVLSLMFKNDNCSIVQIKDNDNKLFFLDSEFIDGKIYDPRPFPSWKIKNGQWQPPKQYPDDEFLYFWNEELNDWQKYDNEFVNSLKSI